MRIVGVFIATLAVMLALIANLLLRPKLNSRLAVAFAVTANVLGFLLYGYGYAVLEENMLVAILKTVYAVFGMFLGRDSMGDMEALTLFSYPVIRQLLYLAQMFALYITASAAISAFGSGLVNRIRLFLFRFGRLDLIYGVTPDSLKLGEELTALNHKVLFVSGDASEDDAVAIRRHHGVLLTENYALEPTAGFVRLLGRKGANRPFTVYAISDDPSDNISYLEQMIRALKQANVTPSSTRAVLYQEEEYEAAVLQNTQDSYGFGSVSAFEKEELAARTMMLRCPPYKKLTFASDGSCSEPFEAVIIGFGAAGREVLKKLLQNTAFPGVSFHAQVFDKAINDTDGALRYRYEALLKHYDIDFSDCDGRSFAVTEYILEHLASLKYVVVTTGDEEMNRRIALDLSRVLQDRIAEPYLLTYASDRVREIDLSAGSREVREWRLFTRELLFTESIDRRAMLLNHYYMGDNGRTAEEDWADCSYFNRMSSRASADFTDAFLAMAGKTREEVLRKGWQVSKETLVNLARAEHDRWQAFHFSQGYRPMPLDVWEERAAVYQKEAEEKGSSSFRISKDAEGRMHACLTPWEALDELSERENRITGKSVDYKAMDLSNVEAVPELLKLDA